MKGWLNFKIAVLVMAVLLSGCGGSTQPVQQVGSLPTATAGQAATAAAVPTSVPATPLPTPLSAPSNASATPLPTQVAGANGNATTAASAVPSGALKIDFTSETVGGQPTSFIPAVGDWVVGVDGDNKVLVVDGSKWSQGQASANIAEQARALYGDRYAEFLDNVQAYAYYPFAVARDVADFSNGEISLRFKPINGRIDQNGGILFGLQPNGDYYTVRGSALENNLILWKVVKGQRTSVEWVRNTPTATGQWHDLKVVINGAKVQGYLDGKLYLEHTLDAPVSGKVGVWSKSDGVVYFDDFTVQPATK